MDRHIGRFGVLSWSRRVSCIHLPLTWVHFSPCEPSQLSFTVFLAQSIVLCNTRHIINAWKLCTDILDHWLISLKKKRLEVKNNRNVASSPHQFLKTHGHLEMHPHSCKYYLFQTFLIATSLSVEIKCKHNINHSYQLTINW